MKPLVNQLYGVGERAEKTTEDLASAAEELSKMAQRRGIHQAQTERPFFEANQKYNNQVKDNLDEIIGHSAKKQSIKADDLQESGLKRVKSADPGSMRKTQPTYIQQLLGINRTNSTSSKYHNNVPAWQQLLKSNNTQALPNPLSSFK